MVKPFTIAEGNKVRKLVKDGLSAREIGALLGRSRNSIIGWTHRNNIPLLSPKAQNLQIALKRKQQRLTEKRAVYSKKRSGNQITWESLKPKLDLAAKENNKSVFPIEAPDDSKNVTFMNLGRFHCRSVVGHPNGIKTIYCGEKVIEGRNWCVFHHKLYFQPIQTRSERNVSQTNNAGNR